MNVFRHLSLFLSSTPRPPFPPASVFQVIWGLSFKIKGWHVCVRLSRIFPLPCFPLCCGVNRGAAQPAHSHLVNKGSNAGWGLPNPAFTQTQGLGWAALGPPCLWLATIRTQRSHIRGLKKSSFHQKAAGAGVGLPSPHVLKATSYLYCWWSC